MKKFPDIRATRYPLRLTLIRTGIEEMSAPEVKERIGEHRHQAICQRDPHPMFVELIAGHEGWSTGRMITGTESRKPARKLWSRERILDLVERLKRGAPVYLFHSQRKSRQRAGEIVAAAERWLHNRLAAVGVAYISDPEVKRKIRTGELDTCSIEAEVECHRHPDQEPDSWVVNAVRKVTGVALGSSRLARPGFSEASLVSMIEEFDESGADDEKPSPSGPLPDQKPSALFSRERLLDDPIVADMIRSCRERDAERIRELTGRMEIKEQTLRELNSRLATEEQKKARELRIDKAEVLAERILDSKNLREQERRIILDEIRRQPPESDEGIGEAVKSRVEGELKKMDRLRELWRVEKISAPPEREARPDDRSRNPLIPRPRGI